MNLSSLEATFEANKVPVLAAAGAGVVGLGLYAKKKKATTATSGGGAVATAAGASSGGQTAGMTGGAAYDSSASDLYGAIQPQLESLGGQLTDLRNLYASATPPTPVPAATANPTPAGSPSPVGAAPPTPVYTDPGLPGQWVAGAANGGLSNGGAVFYPSPSLVTGSYTNTGGQTVTTHYAQPLEQAVWSKGADGLLHNQWGNTTTRLDQYGTPVG